MDPRRSFVQRAGGHFMACVLMCLFPVGASFAGELVELDQIPGFFCAQFGMTEEQLIAACDVQEHIPEKAGSQLERFSERAQRPDIYLLKGEKGFLGTEPDRVSFGFDKSGHLSYVWVVTDSLKKSSAIFHAMELAWGPAEKDPRERPIRSWEGKRYRVVFAVKSDYGKSTITITQHPDWIENFKAQSVWELAESSSKSSGFGSEGQQTIILGSGGNEPETPPTQGFSSPSRPQTWDCSKGPYRWDPKAAGKRGGRCRQYDGKYAKSSCCGR